MQLRTRYKYLVEQPGTEHDLHEVVEYEGVSQLEWFAILHKPWAQDLRGEKKKREKVSNIIHASGLHPAPISVKVKLFSCDRP